MLTKKEERVLKTIKEYLDNNKISPTVRELGELLGLKSTSTVSGYLDRLEKKGCITKRKFSPRSISICNP